MKLISLKLLNYRRFRQEEIIFWDDFSLIFGKNGSGKSSILDAIGYALFGPGSTDFIRVKTELLRSHFVREREPSKVELTFQYAMQTYRVVRVIDAWVKKFASDFIVENKDTLIGQNLEILWGSEVSSEIIKIIWVDRNTFLRSVFAQQKDLEVLSWPREERKALIHSILWLDKIEFLIFDVKRLQKEKKTAFEYLKSKVQNFDIETLEKNISDTQNLIEENQKLLSPLLEEKNLKQTAFEILKKDFWVLQTQKDTFLTLQNSLVTAQNSLVTAQKTKEEYVKHLEWIAQKEAEITTYQAAPEKEQELSKKVQEFVLQKEKSLQKEKFLIEQKKLFQEKQIIENEFNKISEKNISENFEKILEKITASEQNFILNNKQISTLESELAQIMKEANELKAEMQNITDLWADSSCPTCKRPLQDHYPKLMELFEKSLQEKRETYKLKNEQKNQLIGVTQTLEKEIFDLKNEQKILQNEKNSLVEILTKQKNISENLEKISQNISDMWEVNYDEKSYSEAVNHLTQAKKEAQIYAALLWEIKNKPIFEQKIQSLSQEILLWEEKIATLQSDIKTLNFDEQKYGEKKQEYENFYQILNEISHQISQKENILKEQQFQLLTLQNTKKQFESEQQEQKKLMEEVDYLEHKKNVLSQYITHLLHFLKPNIEALTSEYFSKITDGKYSEVSLDENYNIMIDGKTIDLYSGGERDLANLCFRLSLGQNLSQRRGNPINFLVLDEVLGSQDKERQQNIFINLKKLENKFSQILLISHVDEIKEFATNLIEVQSVNREESRVVSY